jgi:alkylation response protein AidB-like acyl-CoA dehydrogenase
MIGRTIQEFGTVEQQRAWLPGLLACRTVWCQGFSEPDSGSDLASVRTKVQRDGDELVLNGVKIWSSNAHLADWMFAVVRDTSDGRPHEGLSFVLIPMDAPGVSIRPIEQITGRHEFAEVFLTDVRIPVENRIGSPGDGWRLAMATLRYERTSSLSNPARLRALLDRILDENTCEELDARFVERVLDAWVSLEAYEMTFLRETTRQAAASQRGGGAMASVVKVTWSELERDLAEIGRELSMLHRVSGSASRDESEWWSARSLTARATTIYAGTSEIQRDVIATRGLGLPRERP